MAGQPSVRINFDKFEVAEEAVIRGTGKAVRALAFALQEEAQNNIQEVGAIDTGSLFNSVYAETSEADGRAKAWEDALQAAKTPGAKSGKPITGLNQAKKGGKPVGELRARVGVCVEHGIYVEMGVVGSAYGDIPARPYLTPAAATIQKKAEGVLAQYVADEMP